MGFQVPVGNPLRRVRLSIYQVVDSSEGNLAGEQIGYRITRRGAQQGIAVWTLRNDIHHRTWPRH